ncbi:MAG TPA: MAPEG family protein [Allosphingosinicella sp.]|nr:MAPEG family protein [Allosphingosinicella sp.]
MILPITLTLAGAAAILHIWLSVRVSRLRRPLKIGFGDGGNEILLRRMRAHSNYAENMPIFIILLGLLELAGGDRRILWGAAIAFILARLLHAFGMDRPGANWLRVGGIGMSWLLLLGLAGWALSYVYLQPPAEQPREIMIGPGRSA